MKDRPEHAFDPESTDDKLYSTTQVAETFSVTSETVREWIKTGKLPGVVLPGGQYRVKRRDLIAFANHKFGLSEVPGV